MNNQRYQISISENKVLYLGHREILLSYTGIESAKKNRLRISRTASIYNRTRYISKMIHRILQQKKISQGSVAAAAAASALQFHFPESSWLARLSSLTVKIETGRNRPRKRTCRERVVRVVSFIYTYSI